MRQSRVAELWYLGSSLMAAWTILLLSLMTGGPARAQTPEVNPGGDIGLGNRNWSAETNRATSTNDFEFSARAGFATDYIYPGTTLSDHGPAAGAALETRFRLLYAGATVATVKLPTQPLTEFTFAGGVRPKIATINFDLGVTCWPIPRNSFPATPKASIIRKR